MKDHGEFTWLVNRPPWVYVLTGVIFLPLGMVLGVMVFGNPPCWAIVPGLLVLAVILVPALAKELVFRVGMGQEKIIFVKIFSKVKVDKSDVLSYWVSHPLDGSELTKPWYTVTDRHLTLELLGGKKIVFKPIEAPLAGQLSEDLEKHGIHLNSELESTPI